MTIYVGPFTGEVGYELLYWIPFIHRKFKDRLNDVVAISRGGTDSWYPCRVLNAYDVVDPLEYRKDYIARKVQTFEHKNWRDDPLDWKILKGFGIGEVAYHPSSMWCWLGHGIETQPPFFPIKKVERWPGLPKKYVAARFYLSEMTEGVRPDLDTCDHPIVALVPKKQIDNHPELPLTGKTHSIVEYDAYNSLEVITRVVQNAQGFAATYGGLSYLGPLCGIPTKAFTTQLTDKHIWAESRLGPNFHKELIKDGLQG